METALQEIGIRELHLTRPNQRYYRDLTGELTIQATIHHHKIIGNFAPLAA